MHLVSGDTLLKISYSIVNGKLRKFHSQIARGGTRNFPTKMSRNFRPGRGAKNAVFVRHFTTFLPKICQKSLSLTGLTASDIDPWPYPGATPANQPLSKGPLSNWDGDEMTSGPGD